MYEKCRKLKKPVIVATQMLESMIPNQVPTRAEVSDIANSIFDKLFASLIFLINEWEEVLSNLNPMIPVAIPTMRSIIKPIGFALSLK